MSDNNETLYCVLERDSLQDLSEDVSDFLHKGWRCQGGVAAIHFQWENERKGYTESETSFYQALVRDQVPTT